MNAKELIQLIESSEFPKKDPLIRIDCLRNNVRPSYSWHASDLRILALHTSEYNWLVLERNENHSVVKI